MDTFDSIRPLLYINEDDLFVYFYLFCPNVTEGSQFIKWSLINIWNQSKMDFILPITSMFNKCPHTLFNQTLILGNWDDQG